MRSTVTARQVPPHGNDRRAREENIFANEESLIEPMHVDRMVWAALDSGRSPAANQKHASDGLSIHSFNISMTSLKTRQASAT